MHITLIFWLLPNNPKSERHESERFILKFSYLHLCHLVLLLILPISMTIHLFPMKQKRISHNILELSQKNDLIWDMPFFSDIFEINPLICLRFFFRFDFLILFHIFLRHKFALFIAFIYQTHIQTPSTAVIER